ncbi:LOW QUALITY PROTEIN: hypothetical protein U9M48_040179 [Paspalum notatum var. saurae]|uniref:Disease resistance R13L4/SHOC-2-like LRR domain-containing protein n=1 Tax=Paspalum notatum var. saurae TaxID=547442 RepID=A0AAQ3XCW6_PASNO
MRGHCLRGHRFGRRPLSSSGFASPCLPRSGTAATSNRRPAPPIEGRPPPIDGSDVQSTRSKASGGRLLLPSASGTARESLAIVHDGGERGDRVSSVRRCKWGERRLTLSVRGAAGHCGQPKMPPGIGKLTALHTLGVVNVRASGSKAILEDLKELTQLWKLGVSGINKNNSMNFLDAISNLGHLESLRLDKDSQDCLEGSTLPLEKLRSLELHGLGEKLPAWSKKLEKITKIDLEMNKIVKQSEQDEELEHVINFLGTLPELCILRFDDEKLIVRGNKNDRELESYKNVKIFQISCNSSSKLQVTFGSSTMKKLEQRKVVCSSASEYQFDGLKNLPELKEVCLKGPNANMQKEDVQSQLNNYPSRPVLKLE